MNVPSPSPAKLRNLVAVLRAHFAKPESYTDEGWDTHLEETAKLLFVVARVGRDAERESSRQSKTKEPNAAH